MSNCNFSIRNKVSVIINQIYDKITCQIPTAILKTLINNACKPINGFFITLLLIITHVTETGKR